jgi:hypothetical protein
MKANEGRPRPDLVRVERASLLLARMRASMLHGWVFYPDSMNASRIDRNVTALFSAQIPKHAIRKLPIAAAWHYRPGPFYPSSPFSTALCLDS